MSFVDEPVVGFPNAVNAAIVIVRARIVSVNARLATLIHADRYRRVIAAFAMYIMKKSASCTGAYPHVLSSSAAPSTEASLGWASL